MITEEKRKLYDRLDKVGASIFGIDYALINGELISTSRTVMEKIALCKKYGAKCALAAVRNKKTKSLIRIILN